MDSNNTSLCEEPSPTAIHIYDTVAWLFENVFQTCIGLAGIMANSLAIPILCSKEMSSIFNRLLVLLAIYDNFYIICSVIEAKRKSSPHNELHEHLFAYGFYQLHNFVLCGSIFLTVALALERYRAVWRPVEYHNQCVGVNPWRRVLISYLLPVVIFSTLFNIPKFLEVELIVKTEFDVMKKIVLNQTTNQTYETNVTVEINRTWAAPTDLRLDDTYVVVYVNLARLLVQGIIPIICLSFLNYRIYWVMKRRSQLVNRPQPQPNGASNQAKKANEAQQAVVLFVIVLLFFLCHSLRFILNVHELINLDVLRSSIDTGCNDFSLWALGTASISNCLMTLNSSANFFIYAFTSSTFRDVLRSNVKKFMPTPIWIWISNLKKEPEPENFENEPAIPVRAEAVSPKIGVENEKLNEDKIELHQIELEEKPLGTSATNVTTLGQA